MDVLQDQRERLLTAIALARLADRAGRRVRPERLVVGAAVVVAGEAEAAGRPQNQQRRGKRERARPPARAASTGRTSCADPRRTAAANRTATGTGRTRSDCPGTPPRSRRRRTRRGRGTSPSGWAHHASRRMVDPKPRGCRGMTTGSIRADCLRAGNGRVRDASAAHNTQRSERNANTRGRRRCGWLSSASRWIGRGSRPAPRARRPERIRRARRRPGQRARSSLSAWRMPALAAPPSDPSAMNV